MAELITIEVRTRPGELPITLSTDPQGTIAALKQTLAAEREGWDATSMNLIRQGRFLNDDKTLTECELCDGEFIVASGMVSRPMPSIQADAVEPLDGQLVSAQPQVELAPVRMVRE